MLHRENEVFCEPMFKTIVLQDMERQSHLTKKVVGLLERAVSRTSLAEPEKICNRS